MNLRFRKRELIIILLLLITSIAFITLFYIDLSRRTDISDRDVIGTVEFKNNIVQRKFDGHMVWETIKKNSLITNRDTLRSDSSSDAMIRLNDGTVISMDENSMFYLDISGKDPTLDLSKGNINVKKTLDSKESIRIKSDSTIVSIKNGELNLNKNQDGSFSMYVEKGEASVIRAGEIQKVETGKFAEISEDSIQVKKIPFQLISPSNNTIITSKSDRETVDFQWKPLQTFTNHKLQISKSMSFEEIAYSVDYPTQSEKVVLPLGGYYWRISSKEGNSPVYKIQIYRESSVSSKLPTDNVILSYVEKLPTVFFQWNEDPLAKEYVLEIAEDKKFESLSSRYPTKSNSMAVDNLSQGEYFWRVKTTPVNETLPTKITQPKTFRIQKTTDFAAPVLVRPVNLISGYEEFSSNGIFVWEGSNEFVEYEFKLSKNSDFSKELASIKLKRNFYKPDSPLSPGEYFWKVRGISATGKLSSFSLLGKLEILPEGMEISPVVPLSDSSEKLAKDDDKTTIIQSPKDTVIDLSGKNSIRFEWSRWKQQNEEYVISLFYDENNMKRPIFQVKTKGMSYEYKNLNALNEGKFTWDISVVSSGRVVHKESSKFLITIAKLRSLRQEDIEFISPPVLYRKK